MRRNLWCALSAALVLAGCSGPGDAAAPEGPTDSTAAASGAMAAAVAPMAEASAVADRAIGIPAQAPAAPGMERMVVRTATLSMQVADVRKTADEVAKATLAADGFLGASRLWREAEHERASMTIRVPAARLDATLAGLRALAVRVDDEAVSGEDVTRQAVDLRAQLTNLRATEVELRALLVTVRTQTRKASDVLEVHAELSRVRGEIEQLDAQLQSLTQMAALSTITLELRPDVVATPIATDSWQPRGVLRDATRALVATARVLVNGAIWTVVYALPLSALVGAVILLLRRVWQQRRRLAPIASRVG